MVRAAPWEGAEWLGNKEEDPEGLPLRAASVVSTAREGF